MNTRVSAFDGDIAASVTDDTGQRHGHTPGRFSIEIPSHWPLTPRKVAVIIIYYVHCQL